MNPSLYRELAPKEAELHTPRIWNSIGFRENTLAAPSPSNPLKNKYTNEKAESTNKLKKFTSKPTFPSNTVQKSHSYVPNPQQMEPRQATSSTISPSSLSVPPPSPLVFVPLVSRHPTPGDNLLYQQNIRSISQSGISSPATIPPRSASSETPSANQTAQLPPQNPEYGTAPWISAWRKLRGSKKPIDDQFFASRADLQQKIPGTSSTVSTSQATQIGSSAPIASSTFSQSSSIGSPPSTVEFPPTPVFTDQIPEGFKQKAESLSVEEIPKASKNVPDPKNFHPLQNSTAPSSSNSPPRQQPMKFPSPTRSVRRGYWNRRGDHLTSDGYLVFPPPSMQYPDDLKTYPKQGYRNHIGLYISWVKRPELPQSLPKDGKPPERPYESVSFIFRIFISDFTSTSL